MFVLRPLLLPFTGGRMWALISECKIDQVDVTDWMSCQHQTSWSKSALFLKPLAQNTQAFNHHGYIHCNQAEKTKIRLNYKKLTFKFFFFLGWK